MRPVVIIVNSPLFVSQHLKEFIEKLSLEYPVVVACSADQAYALPNLPCQYSNISICRNPSFGDLYSLFLVAILRFKRFPKLVISFTPKAGLLNALTFILPGTSVHYFTGQRWSTLSGSFRWLLMLFDWLIAMLMRIVYCDSHSQASFLSSKLLIKPPRVIGYGSIKGVDHSVWIPSSGRDIITSIPIFPSLAALASVSLPSKRAVFGFVGRVCRDKGIFVLINAFITHLRTHPNSILILVGPIEDVEIVQTLRCYPNSIFYISYTSNVPYLMPFFDALVLPSYREGFGSVVLEAAACKIPSIVTRIPGPTDFVMNRVNGYIVSPGNSLELSFVLDSIALDPSSARSLGEAAYLKSLSEFKTSYVVGELLKEIIFLYEFGRSL